MKNRRLLVVGAALWILGLGMTIAGLNIPGNAGKWIGVIGNVLFLIGLMLEGVCWFRVRRSAEDEAEEKRRTGNPGTEPKAEAAPAERTAGGEREKTKGK